MPKPLPAIDDELGSFIRRQHLFFVATAPQAADGLLNLSPKGLDTFAILDPLTVAYLDLTGSGIETVAHLRENGRIVIMFCAFEGKPRILRLHGQGRPIAPGGAEFDALAARFPPHEGVRSIIPVKLTRISTSCGYGVPLYEYRGERPTLSEWCHTKGSSGLAAYRQKNNAHSIDGLPGL